MDEFSLLTLWVPLKIMLLRPPFHSATSITTVAVFFSVAHLHTMHNLLCRTVTQGSYSQCLKNNTGEPPPLYLYIQKSNKRMINHFHTNTHSASKLQSRFFKWLSLSKHWLLSTRLLSLLLFSVYFCTLYFKCYFCCSSLQQYTSVYRT